MKVLFYSLIFFVFSGVCSESSSSFYSENLSSVQIESQINPDLKSPQATFNTFMNLANPQTPEALKRLLSTLDIEHINERIREHQGKLLAETLHSILSKGLKIKATQIPENPKNSLFVLLSLNSGDIILKKMESGNWVFAKESLDNLIAMQIELKDKENLNPSIDFNHSLAFIVRSKIMSLHPGLMHTVFILQNYQWLGLFILIVLGALIHGFCLLWSHKLIYRAVKKHIPIPKDMTQSIGKPLGLLAASLFWSFSMKLLGLPPSAEIVLIVAIRVLISLSTVWFLWKFADWVSDLLLEKAQATDSKFDDLLVPMVRTGLRIFVVVIGLLIVADALNLPINTLLGGLTIGSLAFALAGKDTLENLFGSLTVLLDRPFNIGDWVIIGDTEGTVEKLGFRSTRIRTFYNSLISMPNSNLIKATVDNMGSRVYRRIKTYLSVQYDTPPEKIVLFKEGITELIRNHPYTRKDYYHVYLNEFSASSLDLLLYCFVQVPDWGTELRERERLFLDIIRLAKELDVQFAFPTQTLHIKNEDKSLQTEKKNWTEAEIKNYSLKMSGQHIDDKGHKPPPVSY
jgi:MscS family membrane protein